MTPGAFFVIGTTLTWLGWFAVARVLFQVFTMVLQPIGYRKDRAARDLIFYSAVAAILLVVGLTLLQIQPLEKSTGGGIGIPIYWPIFPFALWATIVCGALAAYRLYQRVLAGTNFDKRQRTIQLCAWVVAGLVFFTVFRWTGDKGSFVAGHVDASIQTVAAVAVLAVAGIFSMVFAAKAALFRNWSRTIVIHAALLAGSVVFGLPFFWLLLTSFKEDQDMTSKNGGLVWVPRVQETVPFRDPQDPLYQLRYEGETVEGQIINQKPGGRVEVDISQPFGLRGYTTVVDPKELTEIDREAPVVTGTLQGQKIQGMVIKELEDGRRRVKVTSPKSLAGQTYDSNPNDVDPVRNVGLRWRNYSDSLEYLPMETNNGLVYLKNTLIIVILSVVGTILSSAIVAYAFSRLRFPGRDPLFAILISTMMLPGAVTLLPTFLIYKRLGWIDTLMPLWVPAFFASAFNVFLLRQFFRNIPLELEDAAKVDGCSYLRTFWSVMIPQIKPALAVIAIWTFMGAWNNFIGPLIYINSPEKMPLSYAVQLFSGDRQQEPGLIMAFSTMSMLPVLLLFFFAQRYFIEGVTLSGLGGK